MNRFLADLVGVMLATALVALEAGAQPVTKIVPLGVIECAEFVGEACDLEAHDGDLYVLDPMERGAWRIVPATGEREWIGIGRGAGRVKRPHDMFFDGHGAMRITDPETRAVLCFDARDGRWRREPCDHRVFYGAGLPDGYVLNAARDQDGHLADVFEAGRPVVRAGQRLRAQHEYPSLEGNLNYVRVAASDALVAMAHIAVAHIQVARRDGGHLFTIDLDGPEISGVRSWHLGLDETADATRPTLELLIEDLKRMAQPERFAIPVYIAGIRFHENRLLVLSDGVILVYDLQGRLLEKLDTNGKRNGERVCVHAFAIDAQGRLYGMDTVHYLTIYDFGPISGLGAGSTGAGTGEDENQGG